MNGRNVRRGREFSLSPENQNYIDSLIALDVNVSQKVDDFWTTERLLHGPLPPQPPRRKKAGPSRDKVQGVETQ